MACALELKKQVFSLSGQLWYNRQEVPGLCIYFREFAGVNMANQEGILVVGIAGGTGSGKTTITKAIQKYFKSDVTVISHDNYYKAHHDLSYEERCSLNFDHPNAFDTDLLVTHLAALRRGETIECPVYDFTVHDRSENTILIHPTRIIVVEGILIFCEEELRALMDIKLFVDADADVRILRRIIRDVRDRGRSLDSVIHQYLTTVKPMHEAFVEPSKRYADIIIPEGGKNAVATEMVIQRLAAHLQ